MATEKQVSYGLKFQARALVALPGEGGHSRWLVGTNALRDENEARLLHCSMPIRMLAFVLPELSWYMICSGGCVGF